MQCRLFEIIDRVLCNLDSSIELARKTPAVSVTGFELCDAKNQRVHESMCLKRNIVAGSGREPNPDLPAAPAPGTLGR
jgi:hypothetical protein